MDEMHKRHDLLERVRDVLRGGKPCADIAEGVEREAFERLLGRMMEYYTMYDLETGETHGKIFAALYLEDSFFGYDEVAFTFSIHVYTLDRYRQRYNRLAEKLISGMKNGSISQKL